MWMEGNDRLPWASTVSGRSWGAKVALLESTQIDGGLTSPGPMASTLEVLPAEEKAVEPVVVG